MANPQFYVNDGFSGTNFERPGFQEMLAQIEAGKVANCIVKDLSRLGRNSVMTGLYTTLTFPKYGTRFIAINDNFDIADTNSVNNDFARIKNWFNEFYARDTSRKIRAVQKSKGEKGIPLTVNIPYGYQKDPNDPHHWIIDREAALVVKHIFTMCMEGRGPSQIAKQLKADKILTPTAYKKHHGRQTPHPLPENPYGWRENTIVNILEHREYTGCTVNFKTYTNSIWDKKQRETPLEKQAVFPNTHERIIEDDVFAKVPEIRQQRHRMTRSGRTSMFADCGSKMNYGSTNNHKPENAFFDYFVHRKHKEKCSTHYIRESVLERMVLRHIQLVTEYILRHKEYFMSVMGQQMRLESSEKIQVHHKKLERNQKRIAELKRLFIKIYEDNAAGRLSDERFDMMSESYESEQKQLKEEAVALQQEIEIQERQHENIELFIQKADKYVAIEKLTPYALRELVQGIYVEAPDKSSSKRRQSIRIKYDGIGFIPLDELINEKTA